MLLLTVATINPAPVIAETQAGRNPAVVELYTSQGCSSCPPADRLLGELAAMPNVIALAFHVDYWDDLGWRDPFEIPDATGRAEGYVRALGLSSAFTPQAIIDGRTSHVGSDERQILQSLAAAPAQTVPVTLQVSEGLLIVTLPEQTGRKALAVFAAAYLPHASTPVRRGENSGKTLEDFNIVRQFRLIGTWKGHAVVFRIPLQSFPMDTPQVAVLVQRKELGPIAGSAAIALR